MSFWLVKTTPTGFIPTEDQGFVLYAVNTPPGSSLDRTRAATLQMDSIIRKDPAANHLYVIDGLNFISNASASPYAAGFMRLKDYKDRGAVKDPDQIANSIAGQVSQVKGASAFFFNFPRCRALVT